jgi:hypothetical protein
MKIILAVLSILITDPQEYPKFPPDKTFETDAANPFKDRSDWKVDLEASRDITKDVSLTAYYLRDGSKEKMFGLEIKKTF